MAALVSDRVAGRIGPAAWDAAGMAAGRSGKPGFKSMKVLMTQFDEQRLLIREVAINGSRCVLDLVCYLPHGHTVIALGNK